MGLETACVLAMGNCGEQLEVAWLNVVVAGRAWSSEVCKVDYWVKGQQGGVWGQIFWRGGGLGFGMCSCSSGVEGDEVNLLMALVLEW